ncbi:hypothetical protein GF1_30340 [Desulfolithobacter dissulfuricans]|uniref:Uncharacterized protein n=2 Tax=Desulfolithobacter dissulfuricans TaxID=2795293 RepID=A0A915U3L3_9BACT|nr:hypothetical protein GF1_30340 [Desulfolithobacter dissulfuricans]
MCLEIRKTCKCGKKNVQFHMRDNVMSQEVLVELYCPECATGVELNPETMLSDNGWVIEYDMELATFLAVTKLQVDPDLVRPGYLFDEGLATWLEMYPGEQQDILAERQNIMDMLKDNPRKYLETINSWNIARVEQLKADGWRKAQAA